MERARQANNKTGLKSFDRLAGDGRVKEIRREGEDGYWLDLAPGWRTYDGLIGIHGRTVRAVLGQMRGLRWERVNEVAPNGWCFYCQRPVRWPEDAKGAPVCSGCAQSKGG